MTHTPGNRFFDPIKFNQEVFAICKSRGLVGIEDITEEEWMALYKLAEEDYDSALADAIFYATF